MHSRLAEILKEKQTEVIQLKKNGVLPSGDKDLPSIRDFKNAIHVPDKISLIAEIKFASPSAGIIREDVDPITIGQMYEGAGAAAISLLTDKRFFRGDLNYLPRLKKALSLPILRKDFIIDDIQVKNVDEVYYPFWVVKYIFKDLTRYLAFPCFKEFQKTFGKLVDISSPISRNKAIRDVLS